MSVILTAHRQFQKKKRADLIKAKAKAAKKKQEREAQTMSISDASFAAHAQAAQAQAAQAQAAQQTVGYDQYWDDDVYDDSPKTWGVEFDTNYSEWKFLYGPDEHQAKVYAVRLYRTDRTLFVNGNEVEAKDYKLEQLPGDVIKVFFKVGKYKCEIKSDLKARPTDKNQILFFNGNLIQFDPEDD